MPAQIPMLYEDERSLILRNALPSMAAMIASSFCALLDGLLLGRLGAQTSAAVSVSLSILMLIQTIGFTLGMGAGSFISRSLGGKQPEAALRAASTAFYLALILSLLFSVAGFFSASFLSRMLGAEESIRKDAVLYMRFVLLSGPLLCQNLVLSSLLRALGQTKQNMAAFSAGAALGTALQYLFIVRLSLGIIGSGVAMLVREGVTFLFLLRYACRCDPCMRPSLRLFALSRQTMHDIMRSGLPTLIRQGLTSLSGALLSRVSASFGPAALAGMGLCARAVSVVSSAIIGFGQGFQPVCGYAFGAGDIPRIRRAYRFCLRCLLPALSALSVILFFLAGPLLTLFHPDPQVYLFAKKALRIQSLVFSAQGAVIMMNMLTQSMGFTIRASVIASSRQGFVLIPLLLFLPRLAGQTGLLAAQSVSDLLSLLLCFGLTRNCLSDRQITRCACAPCEYSDARTASR